MVSVSWTRLGEYGEVEEEDGDVDDEGESDEQNNSDQDMFEKHLQISLKIREDVPQLTDSLETNKDGDEETNMFDGNDETKTHSSPGQSRVPRPAELMSHLLKPDPAEETGGDHQQERLIQ